TAGCMPVNGAQALTYVRARHFQWLDVKTGKWRDDPQSDLSRIARQQYFMRSLAKAALERGASNPATAFALLDNISSSLQKDQNLQLSDIKALINAFRDLDPQSVEMLTVPVVGTTRGAAQVLVPQEPEADAMINRLRNFSSLPSGLPHLVKTSTVQV